MLALDPHEAQSMASRIARALEQAVAQPVLLCSPALRPHLWRLFSRVLPHIGVLSHSEVPTHVQRRARSGARLTMDIQSDFAARPSRRACARPAKPSAPRPSCCPRGWSPARGWRGWLGGREVEVTAAIGAGVSETSVAPTGTVATTRTVDRCDARPRRRPRAARSPAAAPPASAAERPIRSCQLLATGLDRDLAARVARAVPRGPRRTRRRGHRSGAGHASSAALVLAATSATRRSRCSSARRASARRRPSPRSRRRSAPAAGAGSACVAADGFRVGAVEQLRLYADIIGSPFAVARTPDEIERSLVATQPARCSSTPPADRRRTRRGAMQSRCACRRCPACARTWCCRRTTPVATCGTAPRRLTARAPDAWC